MYYTRQPPPKAIIPVKIAVVGPPKSGKTTGLFIFYLNKKNKNFLFPSCKTNYSRNGMCSYIISKFN
jgi:predicted AAA+ superfamily ATPase